MGHSATQHGKSAMASAVGGPSEPDGLIAEYTHSRMVHLGSGSFAEYCVRIRRGDLVWQVTLVPRGVHCHAPP